MPTREQRPTKAQRDAEREIERIAAALREALAVLGEPVPPQGIACDVTAYDAIDAVSVIAASLEVASDLRNPDARRILDGMHDTIKRVVTTIAGYDETAPLSDQVYALSGIVSDLVDVRAGE